MRIRTWACSAKRPDTSAQSPVSELITVLVAGGGTAGHIEPAMAVADALISYGQENHLSVRVIALGTEKGLEKDIIPARGYQLFFTNPIPLPRKLSMDLVKLPWNIVRSIRTVRTILRTQQVDIVIGFGGYVALSAYLAARLPSRYPIIVHEANVVPGLANRIGARWATRVLSSSARIPLPATVVGTPIRAELSALQRADGKLAARKQFSLPEQGPVLLVFGGSQGAQFINNTVASFVEDLLAAGISIIHAHGPKNTPIALSEHNKYPGTYHGIAYINDMVSAYAASDVVIARSGAMSVAEISAVGLPAIYIPLPHGNGEQAYNIAEALEVGAAISISEHDIRDGIVTSADLSELVKDIVFNKERHQNMSAQGAQLLHAHAAETVANIITEELSKIRSVKSVSRHKHFTRLHRSLASTTKPADRKK